MRSWSFAKGHGTRNDFVIVTDRHGMLQPTVEDVRHVCDRRVGVGGDGFLRAIKASHMPGWEDAEDLWFMDARNADGSPAVVGGNGLRVFVRYLRDQGLIDADQVRIATKLGIREARTLPDGRIVTSTGAITGADVPLEVAAGDHRLPARGVVVDVAHAVAQSDVPLSQLDFGRVDICSEGAPADFDNACFWAEVGDRRVALRHWQRNIGQSVSCGTGAVATAWAYLHDRGEDSGRVVVDVQGGWLEVEIDEEGNGWLYGPAHLTVRGEVTLPDPQ